MNYLKISVGLLIVLAASRFIPHPPNFTSLIALSFYVPILLGNRYIPALILCFAIPISVTNNPDKDVKSLK